MGTVGDLNAMLEDLELLVNTESPSHDAARLAESAQAIASIIERRLGTAATLLESAAGPHVHWSGGGTPRVLLLGHHDTVFPVGSCAARPFAVADGRATGPGVFDMKAGIVLAIHAVAALAASGDAGGDAGGDASGVEILITSDEEVGSRCGRPALEERARACGAVLVLEPSADGGALKTARKGVGRFDLVVHGRAAHAGLEPEKGVNALVAAAALIARLPSLADPAKGTTVTPTLASAGSAENVVPAEAQVVVDVRVAVDGERERLDAAFADLAEYAAEAVSGARVEVRGGIDRPPMAESASARLFPLAVAAARECGLEEVRGVAVGGGSDGNFTAALGIPTLDGLGAIGGGAHTPDEYVLIDALVPRARLLAALLRRI
jgi:glutamate carboxypeptidase